MSFTALKNQYFHPRFKADWHYAIFGHFHTTDNATDAGSCLPNSSGLLPDPGSMGLSVVSGRDFVVAMGNLNVSGWLDIETLDFLPGSTAPDYAVASVFMHELGHNFGLQHGGDTAFPNWKPNYVSVMNYAYGGIGQPILTYSSTTPSGLSYRIDYSDENLPAISESDLDETVGLQSLHPNDVILWWVPGPAQLMGPASGPIDWNGDGDTVDTHLSIDLNNNGFLDKLSGFNDWAYILQQLSAGR